MGKNQFLTAGSSRTKKFGEVLAKKILAGFQGFKKKKKAKGAGKALVLALIGGLGGGKTTFTQGFAKGLGIKEKILSPTFVIIRRYGLINKKAGFDNFFHIDCYRIKKSKELISLGFEDIVSDPRNIVAIEWAGRVKKILPKDVLALSFEFAGKNKRKIKIFPAAKF